MSALDRLCARIEKRSGRLRAAHMQPVPRTVSQGRAELADLGAYVSGEPMRTSRRRAYLERWLAQANPLRGRYGTDKVPDPHPLPRTLGLARTELTGLGAYVLGEPGHVSRRRAALTRAFPDLVPVALQLELDALGAYRESEPGAVTKRRDKLRKQRDRYSYDVED